MKKKLRVISNILSAFACILCFFALSGCSGEGKTVGNVTLGKYRGIELTKITDAAVDEEIQSMLAYYATTSPAPGRAAQLGDSVNIFFEGTIDGSAFSGSSYTAEDDNKGFDLVLGSGTMPEGFEEGIVGAKEGETVTVSATFPEDYGNTEVNGKTAQFLVTVNSVSTQVYPEFTDSFVAELTSGAYTTTQAYRIYMEDYLNQVSLQEQLVNAVVNASTLLVRDNEEIEKKKSEMVTQYQAFADNYGLTYEDFIYAFFNGTDKAAFDVRLTEYAEQVVKEKEVFLAIAKVEKLSLTDEEYTQRAGEYAAEYGFESLEEFLSNYDEAEIREVFLWDKAIAYCMEKANIVDK